MEKRTTWKRRFGGFALWHLAISGVGCAVLLLFWGVISLAGGSNSMVLQWLWVALLMLLYVPAGASAARRWHWTRPTRREAAVSVLAPALVAWAWALGGWAMLSSGREGLAGAGLALLLSTALLASPSFFLMFTALMQTESDLWLQLVPAAWSAYWWYAAMFLAGLLPPLLFAVGGCLPKIRLTSGKIVIK